MKKKRRKPENEIPYPGPLLRELKKSTTPSAVGKRYGGKIKGGFRGKILKSFGKEGNGKLSSWILWTGPLLFDT